MTLDRLRPVANRVLSPVVGIAVTAGLTPNTVSVLAFLCALVAAVAYLLAGGATALGAEGGIGGTQGLYLVGAAFVFASGWLDLLDGELARELDVSSPAGDLLDHVLDRYADIALVAGLAGGLDRYLLGVAAVTGVLMTSYLGTQTQAIGLERTYGGLVGRADRLALIGGVTVLAAIDPTPVVGLPLVGWLLVLLAAVGHLTAIQRFYHGYRAA